MQAAQQLHAALAWNERLRIASQTETGAAQYLPRIQQWQRQRLHLTYADLLAQNRYQAACEFFLDELYGGKDFTQRHRDLERVEPIMSRIMPEHLLATVAIALEVQALSLELDLALSAHLAPVLTPTNSTITQQDYAQAFRHASSQQQRQQQITMIMQVGNELDAVVHKYWVYQLLRLLRGPATAAGFGELQHFLETGFAAFKQLQGAQPFLTTIQEREQQAISRIYAGDDQPFAELGLP